MHQLGISIYPEHSTEEKDFAYMELAAKYGFKRIFTCLLSVKETKEEIIEKFTRYMKKAHELGFKVAVDTHPSVFKMLGANSLDIRVFKDMGVDIIRLDMRFGDMEDLFLLNNEHGIKIEFNGSCLTSMDLLINRGANKNHIMMCHNFYPQKYTGLGWEKFMNLNREWKKLSLHNAAFVSSNQENTFGPWPVASGLITCEVHRGLPIEFQARHLLATGMIDDVIIGNAFASEAELKALSMIDLEKPTLRLELVEGVSDVEREITYSYRHFGRQDSSDYMLRSFIPRLYYRDKKIPARAYAAEKFTRGDIVIVNDNLAHYRGELQVILQDMPNDGERNLIGRLSEQEIMILDLLKEDIIFGFIA